MPRPVGKGALKSLLADKSRTKRPRNIKISRTVYTARAIMRISFKVKGQGQQAEPCAETESVSPMNFKLGKLVGG